MAVAFQAPFVSGKDSLNNVFAWTDAAGVSREISIPPTLLATALGQVDDVRRVVAPDLKAAGNRLAVVGLSHDDVVGSQLELAGRVAGGRLPTVDVAVCRGVFAAVAAARGAGLLQACHDCSDGGLLTAVAEMAIGGATGARIDLAAVPADLRETASAAAPARDLAIAFGETPARFVCEVRPGDAEPFAAAMRGVRWAWIGEVVAAPVLEVVSTAGGSERIPVERLAAAWRSTGGTSSAGGIG
jgi:phosphoribosylformylglycinamidine synthase